MNLVRLSARLSMTYATIVYSDESRHHIRNATPTKSQHSTLTTMRTSAYHSSTHLARIQLSSFVEIGRQASQIALI